MTFCARLSLIETAFLVLFSIAYVRNIDKNDWWKMDDGRVNPVHVNEVLEAEAYMLFYRVVQHPLTQELENCYRTMMNRAKMEKALEDAIIIDQDSTARQLSKVETQPKPITTGKRKLRSHSNGQEWARTKKNLPPHMISIIHKVQERIADNTQLSPEFFRRLSEAASSDGAHASNTAISIVEDISNSLPAAVADITGTSRSKGCLESIEQQILGSILPSFFSSHRKRFPWERRPYSLQTLGAVSQYCQSI